VAAVVAAGIIAWNGWRLLRPALDELMDASPSPAMIAQICDTASIVPDVVRIEKCVVRKTGLQFLVDMHLEVDGDMTVVRAHEVAHRVKDHIRQRLPIVSDVLIHIEPARRPEPPEHPDRSATAF
jgi:divalent metal cation (Fe/Co/Zn/Cd) transporter